MLNLIRVMILFLVLLVVSSCNNKSSSPSKDSCSDMTGAWVACFVSGGTSTQITWAINNAALGKTTDTFATNTACAGTPDTTSTENYTMLTGTIGQSTYVSGATEFELRRAGANIGCGVDQPTYDRLILNDGCGMFYISDAGPKCDPGSVSTNVNVGPHVRQ